MGSKIKPNGKVSDVDRNDLIDLAKTVIKIIGDLLKK